MKIVSGSSHPDLAHSLATALKSTVIPVELSTFANGEKRVWVKEAVRGEDVIIVQSFSHPSDEHIIEFLLLADSLERMGARRIILVLPWMGYSLQDKVFREGEPIAAKVIANLVSTAHIKRVFLLDLHNSSTPGFFSIPTEHLSALSLFVEYAQKQFQLSPETHVVASPDFGGIKRSRVFAEKLGLQLVNIDKHRDLNTGETQAMGLSGELQGRSVLVFDDVINSGSTVVTAAEFLKEHGAKEVHFFATHGILADKGPERITNSAADSVIITNSIAQAPSSKLHVLDITPVFAQALAVWQ